MPVVDYSFLVNCPKTDNSSLKTDIALSTLREIMLNQAGLFLAQKISGNYKPKRPKADWEVLFDVVGKASGFDRVVELTYYLFGFCQVNSGSDQRL